MSSFDPSVEDRNAVFLICKCLCSVLKQKETKYPNLREISCSSLRSLNPFHSLRYGCYLQEVLRRWWQWAAKKRLLQLHRFDLIQSWMLKQSLFMLILCIFLVNICQRGWGVFREGIRWSDEALEFNRPSASHRLCSAWLTGRRQESWKSRLTLSKGRCILNYIYTYGMPYVYIYTRVYIYIILSNVIF